MNETLAIGLEEERCHQRAPCSPNARIWFHTPVDCASKRLCCVASRGLLLLLEGVFLLKDKGMDLKTRKSEIR